MTLADATETVKAGWAGRSYKREVAVALLIFWAVMTVKVFFMSTETMVMALVGAYGTVSTMVGMFAMAAFGFDAYIKQLKPGGPG